MKTGQRSASLAAARRGKLSELSPVCQSQPLIVLMQMKR